MLQGKTILVTGASSGIGAATAAMATAYGANVLSVDINAPAQPVGSFFQADLSDKASIDKLIAQLPSGIDGLANIAGLPPTKPAPAVVKVNLVGLKYLTTQLLPKFAQGASIVNLASLAGMGWADSKDAIQASEALDFDGVQAFCDKHSIEGARSYFFSQGGADRLDHAEPLDLARARHPHECGQPRPGGHARSWATFCEDPGRARRRRHARDGPRRHAGRHRAGGQFPAVRRLGMDSRRPTCRWTAACSPT